MMSINRSDKDNFCPMTSGNNNNNETEEDYIDVSPIVATFSKIPPDCWPQELNTFEVGNY